MHACSSHGFLIEILENKVHWGFRVVSTCFIHTFADVNGRRGWVQELHWSISQLFLPYWQWRSIILLERAVCRSAASTVLPHYPQPSYCCCYWKFHKLEQDFGLLLAVKSDMENDLFLAWLVLWVVANFKFEGKKFLLCWILSWNWVVHCPWPCLGRDGIAVEFL
jgi:hypothetical protein